MGTYDLRFISAARKILARSITDTNTAEKIRVYSQHILFTSSFIFREVIRSLFVCFFTYYVSLLPRDNILVVLCCISIYRIYDIHMRMRKCALQTRFRPFILRCNFVPIDLRCASGCQLLSM